MLGGKESMMCTPILFPEHLQHVDMANKFGGKEKVCSAGFVQVGIDVNGEMEVVCFGESQSLKLKSAGKYDAAFVKIMLLDY